MPRSGTKRPVAAVVVTYNRLDLLRQCVQALRSQTEACENLIYFLVNPFYREI